MPLRVIIVGAGLGGLGAAIALRGAGHDVQVIEQSSFLNEVGAAIHIAPNATRILRHWECDFETLQASECEQARIWDSSCKALSTLAVAKDLQNSLNMNDEWLLTHRSDLHNTLRITAEKEHNGRMIDIRLSSRVASVDAEAGVVTLDDGTIYTGDLIIGADGVHSRTVEAVTGEEPQMISTGQNCFRFLVPVSKMQANPLTASLLEKASLTGLNAFVTHDRRLVIYPCRRGTLLNVAGIHSDSETGEQGSSWLHSSTTELLLRTYAGFDPEIQEMCRIAEDVKLWSLSSRLPPSSFVKGKLALIGDAAHPTLPHQGQGAAQAFEDGAALGALFTSDVTPEQVAQRLEMYDRVRYERAVTVMIMSKTSDDRRGEMLEELRRYVPDAELPKDMVAFSWSSYPAEDARRVLRNSGVCT